MSAIFKCASFMKQLCRILTNEPTYQPTNELHGVKAYHFLKSWIGVH